MSAPMTGFRRAAVLGALIVAGEAVFVLPFVLPRVFRPTVLDALEIDNTQLGAAFSVYGIVAMTAYFFGGPLADRFSTRKMMALALVSTAGAGLYYATLPTASGLRILYGLWGVTTILLFWAGLMRATREWGQGEAEGRAYGALDGGRGLLAAVLSTGCLALFSWWVGEATDLETRRQALQAVILAGAGLTAGAGLLIYVTVPDGQGEKGPAFRLEDVGTLLKAPALWLQGVIVVCAYVGYKGTDDLSLLAADVLGYTDVQAASVGTLAFWLRPVAALGAGFVADRIGGWRTVAAGFGLLVLADLGVVWGALGPVTLVLFTSIAATCVAVYALRGVYFALLRDAGIPFHATGTAVGIVSVVGYTPDVFFGPLMGWVLDRAPGAQGHVDLFVLLAGFALVGLLATLGFAAVTRSVT